MPSHLSLACVNDRAIGMGPRSRATGASAPRQPAARAPDHEQQALSAQARALLLARAALGGGGRVAGLEEAAELVSVVVRQLRADPACALSAQAGGLDEERVLDLLR